MNTNQKYILVLATIGMVLMLLFPPFQLIQGQYGTFNQGYHFIAYVPNNAPHPTINIGLLTLQWIAVGVVAFVTHYLLKDKN